MAPKSDRPPLLVPNPDGVPAQMRQAKRWAPWRAVWNEKKKKYEKIPHRAARPEYGLSNKNVTGWVSFDEAMAVYKAHPDKFSGIGYLMTGPHGVVGTDLDHCRDPVTGVIDEWAMEVAAKLDSYTEVSPSGTGLHVMSAGDVSEDWMNHDRGIEVYGGNKARFLCITGARVPGTRADLLPAAAETLQLIEAKYRTSRSKADVEDLHLPPLLPVEFLPSISELDLPAHARNFLSDGPVSSDRSKELINAATALAQSGLAPDEVLSILEDNEHAIEVALDHRQQDYDKALRFLWRHSALQGEVRAKEFKQLRLDEFDDLEPGPVAGTAGTEVAASPTAQVADSADDFDNLDAEDGAEVAAPVRDLSPVKVPRFTPTTPAAFLQRRPASWIIKGIVPRAGLAVIYGASGSGKTFLTLDMVAAVVRGLPWRDAVSKQGRAVYVVAEGASGFRNRLEAYCEFHGVDPSQFDIGVIADAPNLLAKDDVRDLIKALIAFGTVDLIVIDTYARAMAGGNENDAKDVGQAVAHCDIIHRKTGALVVLVHHSGKDATRGARGSGALRAAADLEIEVTKTNEFRAATITKQKDGEDGQEFRFKLAEVVIGEDEDGEAITSCVIEHRGGPAPGEKPARDLPKGAVQRTVLSTIIRLIELDGDPAYNDAVEACVSRIEIEPGKRDRRRELVVTAIEKLSGTGHLTLGGGRIRVE